MQLPKRIYAQANWVPYLCNLLDDLRLSRLLLCHLYPLSGIQNDSLAVQNDLLLLIRWIDVLLLHLLCGLIDNNRRL